MDNNTELKLVYGDKATKKKIYVTCQECGKSFKASEIDLRMHNMFCAVCFEKMKNTPR
jgi:formylmethanofuran dehydrogenase subunit E